MNKSAEIIIENLESLLDHMNKCDLWAEWKVLSDIGPEWIGSSRKICFYLDDVPLGKSEFHNKLKKALSKTASIPETSSDEIIYGEGEVTYKDGVLQVKYWWSKAPPYQDPIKKGSGEGVFVDV